MKVSLTKIGVLLRRRCGKAIPGKIDVLLRTSIYTGASYTSLVRTKTRVVAVGKKYLLLTSSIEAFRPSRVFCGIFVGKNKSVDS